MSDKCPNGLTPDGPVCPRCGGNRGPSGVDGGSWVHCPPSSVQSEIAATGDTPRCDALTFRDGVVGIDLARTLERENAELRRQLAEVKEALAGDDYASLPSDYPLARMAHTIRADHDKFRNQVIDTCKRAETAERQRDEALKDAERLDHLETQRAYSVGKGFLWNTWRYDTDISIRQNIDAAIDAAKESKK